LQFRQHADRADARLTKGIDAATWCEE